MTDDLYPCSRCAGKGSISAFGHVMAGVCFQCKGSGKQKTKPAPKAVKWAVFGHDRNTDKPGRLYNVTATTEAKAVTKAQCLFGNASTGFKDTWTMSKAFALTWEEVEAPTAASVITEQRTHGDAQYSDIISDGGLDPRDRANSPHGH